MCGRCGCVKRGPGTAGVRPAVIEGILEPGLLLLLREGDNYGYELATALAQRALIAQPVLPARVYEALRRLESDGSVLSAAEASPAGPDRRRYSLTPAGRHRLDRWAESLRLAERNLRTVLDSYHQNEG
jgi:PadR family transcriptional regulator PadR